MLSCCTPGAWGVVAALGQADGCLLGPGTQAFLLGLFWAVKFKASDVASSVGPKPGVGNVLLEEKAPPEGAACIVVFLFFVFWVFFFVVVVLLYPVPALSLSQQE